MSATQPTPASSTDVLIAGAGPTGLVLALWLARLGVRVRIIDKTAEPGTTSRALAVQARTLELYGQLGLADSVVQRGRHVRAVNLWVRGRQVTHAVFGNMGEGLSPFPFAVIFPQDEHERLLIDALVHYNVHVERRTELLRFDQPADASAPIRAQLQLPDGSQQTCTCAFLAGCDGARSVVRQQLHIGFPGGEYTHTFYVADIDGGGSVANGELHVALDTADFLAVFPLSGDRHLRLVGTLRDEQWDVTSGPPTWDDVSTRVLDSMKIQVERVRWFSTYRVHHRVADHFRSGRVFLLGDAAHIHSPVGGQGMNTGIGDAINLAWKLAAVLHHRAPASILDTFEPERIAFARRLVATTDRAFTAVTSSGLGARLTRLRIAPFFIPPLFALKTMRHLMFRTVSQTGIQYRASALSEGSAGSVHGGDRLPWVQSTSDHGADNFAPLTSLSWQVHVYGNAPAELHSLCGKRALPLHVFPWTSAMGHAGLRPNALYLIRPDGYVALAAPGTRAATSTLARYLDSHQLP